MSDGTEQVQFSGKMKVVFAIPPPPSHRLTRRKAIWGVPRGKSTVQQIRLLVVEPLFHAAFTGLVARSYTSHSNALLPDKNGLTQTLVHLSWIEPEPALANTGPQAEFGLPPHPQLPLILSSMLDRSDMPIIN